MQGKGVNIHKSVLLCILPTLKVLAGTETLVEYVYVSKGVVTATFGSFELLFLLRINGRVGTSRHLMLSTET